MADPDQLVFTPQGRRDVYWCPYLNEPVIVEWRADRRWCVNCGRAMDQQHEFIVHIPKPNG